MAGRVLSGALAGRAREAERRWRRRRDDLLYPEATSGRDQWQRIPLNRAVDAHIGSLGPGRLSAVEISGDGQGHHPWKAFTSLNYPQFDLCAPLRGQGPFDVVICEQVIEHVEDPWTAAANLRGLCASGGHVIVSTPFLIRVHELWGMKDYWRFTPRGLRRLLEGAELTVDHVGAWGNRACVRGNLDRWPAYRAWHSLRNEPDLPVQVWAFARRA
ncbi:MAG: methyltransferase domain-containing protein [Actinomycetota bacterium]|nr:methyltransferase domain-containing protein [Actinomycetota bacterium]